MSRQQQDPAQLEYEYSDEENDNAPIETKVEPLLQLGDKDLKHLPILSMDTLLTSIRSRFDEGQVYTNAGPVLLALNPFEELDIYDDERVNLYATTASLDTLPAHIYKTAEDAYRKLIDDQYTQAIILTGESGSGKTETAKFAIRYLTSRAADFEAPEPYALAEKLYNALPILEAFGNAATLLNRNASRFVCHYTMQFDNAGIYLGTRINTYLLEKTRLNRVPSQERTFNIFHYFRHGLSEEECDDYHIGSDDTFLMLGESDQNTLNEYFPPEDDAQCFDIIKNAFLALNITEDVLRKVFNLLAAILHLGNIEFSDTTPISITPPCHTSLESAATMIGVNPDRLETFLLQGTQNFDDAFRYKNALMEQTYQSCFKFIVSLLNQRLVSDTSHAIELLIIDSPGFEALALNSVEQLTCNSFNECLEDVIKTKTFIEPQEEFEEDGLLWERLNFVENSNCLDLLVGTVHRDKYVRPLEGILGTLLSSQSSESFVSKLSSVPKVNEFLSNGNFLVKHFPGDVDYNLESFYVNASTVLSLERMDMLFAVDQFHNHPVLQYLDDDPGLVLSQFASNFQSILDTLSFANLWLVRCINPNTTYQPRFVDESFLRLQLEYMCILQTASFYRNSFASQLRFYDFIEKYDLIQYNRGNIKKRLAKRDQGYKTMTDLQPKCVDIIQAAFSNVDRSRFTSDLPPYQIGQSCIYVSDEGLVLMQEKLVEKYGFWAREIQRVWRGYYYGRRLLKNEDLPQVVQEKEDLIMKREEESKNISEAPVGPDELPENSMKNVIEPLPEPENKVDTNQTHKKEKIPENTAEANTSGGVFGFLGNLVASKPKVQKLSARTKTVHESPIHGKVLSLITWMKDIASYPFPPLQDHIADIDDDDERDYEAAKHFATLLKDGFFSAEMLRKYVPNYAPVKRLIDEEAGTNEVIQELIDLTSRLTGRPHDLLFSLEDVMELEAPVRVVEGVWLFYQTIVTFDESEIMDILKNEEEQEEPEDLYTFDMKMERKDEIVKLVEDEESFVKRLRVLISYKKYILSRDTTSTQGDLDMLFGDVEKLYEFHQVLLDQLTDKWGDEETQLMSDADFHLLIEATSVGTIIGNKLDAQDVFSIPRLYSSFSKNWVDSKQFIQELNDDSTLKQYIDAFQGAEKLGAGVAFADYMRQVALRPKDYIPYLKCIDEKTPQGHADKAAILSCIKALEKEVLVITENLVERPQPPKPEEDVHHGESESEMSRNPSTEMLDRFQLPETSTIPMSTERNDMKQRESLQTDRTKSTRSEMDSDYLQPPRHSSQLKISDYRMLEVPTRKFVCKGTVLEVISNNVVKDRVLFLFNDIMIITKEVRGDKSPMFFARTILDLRMVSLRAERDGDPAEAFIDSPYYKTSIRKFLSNPRDGIAYLIDKQILTPTPLSVGHFLHRARGFDKRQIGKFIGDPDNDQILAAFVNKFDFRHVRLDEAMRIFLSTFRLPGDAATIDRILDEFSRHYHEQNAQVFPSAESTLRLVFSILSLNAELHRPKDENSDKHTSVFDFVNKFQAEGDDWVDDGLLEEIYEYIRRDKLVVASYDRNHDTKKQVIIENLPYRVIAKKESEPVTITLPSADPRLLIKLIPSDEITCDPPILMFRNSASASFRIHGNKVGKFSLYMLKLGPHANDYSSEMFCFGRTVVVEPEFMKSVFQMKTTSRDPALGRRVSYMFSVANEVNRKHWLEKLGKVYRHLNDPEVEDIGLPLINQRNEHFFRNFLFGDFVKLVPTNAKVDLLSEEGDSFI